MPRYVVVKNKGRAYRDELFVMGGRDIEKDYDSGLFRTGAKEAAASEIVRGRDVHFFSSDEKGRYHLTYEQAATRVGNRMVAVIQTEGEAEPHREVLTYTTHVGEHWGRPVGDDKNVRFKALKEFVINASETGRGQYEVVVTDSLPKFAPEGETWAALEWTKDIDQLLLDWPLYFKEPEARSWEWDGYENDHEPIAELGRVQVYPKTTADDQLNVFVRTNGIAFLAHCRVGLTTAFDYVLIDEDGDLLGRDRELRNLDDALKLIGNGWSSCSNVDALAKLLKAATNEDYLEAVLSPGYFFSDKAAVAAAFEKAFPGKAAFHDRDASPAMKQDAINAGYEVVEVTSWGWDRLLKDCDVPTTEEAAGYTNGAKTRQLTAGERKSLKAALEVMCLVDGANAALEGYRFVAFNDGPQRMGFHSRERREVGVSEIALEKGTAVVLGVLLHEAVHAIGKRYHDQPFAAVLEGWLADLAMSMEG